MMNIFEVVNLNHEWDRYQRALMSVDYLLKKFGDFLCPVCKHYISCTGEKCPVYKHDQQLGLGDCRDLMFGACKVMRHTPCKNCDGVEYFQWDGKEINDEHTPVW